MSRHAPLVVLLGSDEEARRRVIAEASGEHRADEGAIDLRDGRAPARLLAEAIAAARDQLDPGAEAAVTAARAALVEVERAAVAGAAGPAAPVPEAVALADRLAALGLWNALLAPRRVVGPGDLDTARERLAAAQEVLAEVQVRCRPPEVGADVIAAVEEAQLEAYRAEARAERRLAGRRASRRLARAREEQRRLLAELGFSSYAEFRLRVVLPHLDVALAEELGAAEQAVEHAAAEVEAIEAEIGFRAEYEAVSVEHGEVRRAAALLLFHEVETALDDGDLEQALRRVRRPALDPEDHERVVAARQALAAAEDRLARHREAEVELTRLTEAVEAAPGDLPAVVATVDGLREHLRAGPSAERPALVVLDDPLRDVRGSERRSLLREIAQLAGWVRVVYLTEDRDVAAWARRLPGRLGHVLRVTDLVRRS